MAFVAEHT